MAKRNPLIVAPPRKNITIRTRIEVTPVFRVRLNVSFRARLRTSIVGRFLWSGRNSLTLSKTTTESFSE
jgi:hypothetical protein